MAFLTVIADLLDAAGARIAKARADGTFALLKLKLGTGLTATLDQSGDTDIVTLNGGAVGAAGGDLSGTYPNPTVAKVNGTTVPTTSAPDVGKVLTVTGANAAAWSTPANGAIQAFTVLEIENQANITASGTSRTSSQGVALPLGTRVWLNAQSTPSQNGGYIVQSGAWTRIPELPAGAHFSGVEVMVTTGTGSFWAGTIWKERLAINPADVVGTNGLSLNMIGHSLGWYVVAQGFDTLGAGGTRDINVSGVSAEHFTFDSTDRVYVTRNGINSSTAIGHLSSDSSDYSTSHFVVRSFKADGTAETNDRSNFQWMVVRKFGVH